MSIGVCSSSLELSQISMLTIELEGFWWIGRMSSRKWLGSLLVVIMYKPGGGGTLWLGIELVRVFGLLPGSAIFFSSLRS